MKKLLIAFLLSFTTSAAFGAARVSDHQVAPFRSGYRNYVKNPSARKNTSYTSTSSAALTRVTTAGYKLDGVASYTCNASATNGYCEFTLDTIENPDDSGNCAFTGEVNGDGSLYSAQLLDGSANVLNSVALGNVTAWTPFTINYPCGSSRKVRITQTTAGTSPDVYVGRLYYGRWTGGTTTSQAQLVGTVTVSGCASNWSTTSTTFASLGAQTGCTYSATGAALAPSTNIPAFKFASLPAGEYRIEYEGTLYQSTAAKTAYYQFSDGTNTTREISTIYSAGGGTQVPNASGTIAYTTAQSNVTFELKAKTDTSGTAAVSGLSSQPAVLRLYRFPTSAETGFRADTIGGSWSGYHDITCSWARTSTSFGDPTADSTCTLTERTNTNFGTVTSAVSGSDKLPGIVFTPKRAGKYWVCAMGQMVNATAGADMYAQLVDGSGTVVASRTQAFGGAGNVQPVTLCGEYVASSASSTTLKVQNASSTGANTLSPTGSLGTAFEWSIFTIDQQFPTPILVGSVTSNSSGAERIERALINATSTTSACTASPCSITSQSGNWISSVTRTGTGGYTINFTSGIFSAAPTCTGNFYSSPTANAWIEFGSASTSSINVQSLSNSSTPVDAGFSVMCMGPR